MRAGELSEIELCNFAALCEGIRTLLRHDPDVSLADSAKALQAYVQLKGGRIYGANHRPEKPWPNGRRSAA